MVSRNNRTTGTSQGQVNDDLVAAFDRHLWFCKNAVKAAAVRLLPPYQLSNLKMSALNKPPRSWHKISSGSR